MSATFHLQTLELLLEMEEINILQSLISVQLLSAMLTTTVIHLSPLALISNSMSLLLTVYGVLNIVLPAASDSSMVFELYSSNSFTYYVIIAYL